MKLPILVKKPIAISAVLLGMACFNIYAATPTNNKPKSDAEIFAPDDSVPPGFEALENIGPQTTLVSVYYGNRLLMNTMATFDHDTVKFNQPAKLVKKIPLVKDPEALLKTLSHKLPSNSNLLCHLKRKPLCQKISPKIAGVIFNEATLKAYLFINPDYLDPSLLSNQKLPPSTSGFSSVNANRLLVSHTALSTYSMNANNTFGYGNGHFVTRFLNTYSQQTQGGYKRSLDVNTLAGEYVHNGSGYYAGVIPTGGNGMFTQTVSMIGVRYDTFKDLGRGSDLSQGTPVIVFLPTDSTVEVFRRGELIYANELTAGKHQLNTASFPTGSYDITIKITNSLNEVNDETRFYIKRTDGVDLDTARYTFAAGMIEKDDVSIDQNDTSTVNLPRTSNKAVFSIDRDSLLAPSIDMDLNAISGNGNAFGSADFSFYGDNYTISPGILASTENIYGIATSANTNFHRLYLGLSAAKFYGIGRIQRAIDNKNFMPLSTTDYRYGLNASFNYKGFNLSVFTRRQKQVSGSTSQTSTASLSRSLFNSQLMGVNMRLTASKTSTDKVISLGILATFRTAYIDGNLNLDAQRDNIGNPNSTAKNSFSKTVSIGKTVKYGAKKSLVWGLGASDTRTNRNYNAKLQYTTLPLQVGGSYYRSQIKTSGQFTNRYTANLSSSIVYADGAFGVGYASTHNTGIIVNIESPESGQTNIMNERETLATVANNTTTPIFLPPYRTYNITINPLGSTTQYAFDTQPKSITLYRGNIQHLEWTLERSHIVFAEITDAHGNPLPALLLRQKGKYNTTDDFGYIQSDILEDTSTLNFVDAKGKTCTVTIPKTAKVEDGLMVLDKPLICNLQAPEKLIKKGAKK